MLVKVIVSKLTDSGEPLGAKHNNYNYSELNNYIYTPDVVVVVVIWLEVSCPAALIAVSVMV